MSTDAVRGEDDSVTRSLGAAHAQRRMNRTDPALHMSAALAIEAEAMDATRIPGVEVDLADLAQDLDTRRTGASTIPQTFGLALSGGGIRSATFGLGVLQALAGASKLGAFDYLSTVSGGGYIGSWLSAWIHRAGLKNVQDRLGECGSVDNKGSPTSAEPSEVTWLRRYSNYLAPRVGLLSFDSLTLIATWLRNVVLNAVVILGFLCAVMVIPFLLIPALKIATSGYHYVDFGFAAAWSGIVFLTMVGYNLWKQSLQSHRKREWSISTPGVLFTVVLPAVLTCCFAAIWLANDAEKMPEDVAAACKVVGGLLFGMFVIWGGAEMLKPPGQRVTFSELFVICLAACIAFAAGFVVFAALYYAWNELPKTRLIKQSEITRLLLGPPLLVFAFGISTTVFTGMVGRVYFERSREWWSRLNAWLIAFGLGWALWIGLAFFSLPLLVWGQSQIGGWMALLGTGWIGSLLTALLFKKPEAAPKKVALKVDSILNVAATLFVAGLLVVLSAALGHLLLSLSKIRVDYPSGPPAAAKATYEVRGTDAALAFSVGPAPDTAASFSSIVSAHLDAFGKINECSLVFGLTAPSAVLLVLLLAVVLFSARVDVNKFSLHNMYKNRLIRCYLGASNQAERNEQPFTGLDDDDDVLLAKLGPSVDPQGNRFSAQRPMHILNAALNITQGSNLAWQERKAASFIFTPIVCGYSLERTQGDSTPLDGASAGETPGYRLTTQYGAHDDEEKGFSLGMALATSGAAVSPNMGHASRPVRAFLLTLFNVRLGRWSANPAADAWQLPSPRFGLVPLLQELFGYSNERRNFVYLSDGGHFDNLGVYELVRRRCTTIFAVDAGADPDRKMNDLAEAVRKCRVDLGVEIELSELKFLEGDSNNEALQGFMRGRIRYNLSDSSQDGTLIVIKPTMSRAQDEPVDILNYAQRNPPFPQQTTSDQFFDESQFEAYRRLGLHIASRCLKDHGTSLPEPQKFLPPALPPPPTKAPACSTRFVAFLCHFIGRDRTTSARALASAPGSTLIDLHFSLGVLSLLAFFGFAIFDQIFLNIRVGICFTHDGCYASLQALSNAGLESPVAFTARGWADNVFVLVYSSFFASGWVAASRQSSKVRLLLPAMLVLIGATAIVDTAENIRMLRWQLTTVEPFEEPLAAITQAKFLLGSSLLFMWLFISPSIVRVFRTRWGRRHSFD